jgi:hypothetical protein
MCSRIGTVGEYSSTVFCFSRPQLMKVLAGSAPVTSQGHHVNRHSLACGVFRLKAPLVTHSMKPRSCNSLRARQTVAGATLQRRARLRTDTPRRPLFMPSWTLAISTRIARAGQRQIGGRVQHPSVESHMGSIEPFISSTAFQHHRPPESPEPRS